MAQKPPLIAHVSDTARWVAFYRAMETERPDAIFRDPWARALAGPRGEQIVREMPRGRATAWPMVVRTAVMDEIILRTVRSGADAVLNLAAGLDARPWRLELPAALQWFDVDHPVMIDHKLSVLAGTAPVCRYEGIRQDLADPAGRQALFARVGAAARRVLVISEGLLIYLEADAVAGLARDLHAQPTFATWLMDLASPALVKMLSKNWGPMLAQGQAPFRFAPAENTGFFAPFGWRETEWRPLFDEGRRLHRTMPMAWLWALLGRLAPARKREEFRRFSGIAVLERA